MMGQNISSPISGNIDSLHAQFMKHAGADYDIATATTLTYNQFLNYIMDVNKICANYKDKNECVLVFAVKKGTDSTLFWKATVRVACVKLNTSNNKVESHRLLNIRQFLQLFRRINYEYSDGSNASKFTEDPPSGAAKPEIPSIPPTMAASMMLGDSSPTTEAAGETSGGKLKENYLDECVICLERKPDISLPCCHAYCLPCIEQWWEYCENAFEDECLARNIIEQMNVVDKSCPVCRESLSSTQDTWVLPDVPDSSEVNDEVRKSLISFASSSDSPEQKHRNGT